jgi:hypothetical protein
MKEELKLDWEKSFSRHDGNVRATWDIFKQHMDYKVIRNKVRAATRRPKVKEQEIAAKHCKENPKIFWSYINSKRKVPAK